METCPNEAELLDAADGSLDDARREALLAHVDECPSCLAVLAQTAQDAESLGVRPSLGRFVLLSVMGAGGMGLVYRAYDPTLSRNVALKILPAHLGEVADSHRRERLLKEAKALALVSHPNVVHIYEAGLAQDQVFIAMELIEGETLACWLTSTRTTSEILEVFIQAGNGLAAAHAAGLVHGDFKPHNVLVGTDGRARVIDFGLAEPISGARAAGAIQGTRGYLAPELLTGAAAGPAADQFSLCVALERALEHRGVVPSWVRRIIERGKRSRPEDRHASMVDLLSALGQSPWPRRARRVAGATAVLALGLAALSTYEIHAAGVRLCSGASQRLGGIWDDATQGDIEAAFSRTGTVDASVAFRAAASALSDWTARWSRTYATICEAAITRPASKAISADRMECLQDQLASVRAVTLVLRNADTLVVHNVRPIVSRLPTPEQCGSSNPSGRLSSREEGMGHEEVVRLSADLARARALWDAGKVPEGLELASDCVGRARALDRPLLIADSSLLLGELEFRAGSFATACDAFKEATIQAEAAGDDSRVASAWTERMNALARAGQYVQALDEARMAQACLRRMGNPSHLLIPFKEARGRALQGAGRYPEAIADLKEALALREKSAPPGDSGVLSSMTFLGSALLASGADSEAEPLLRQALAAREALLGPEHPDLGAILTDLGELERHLAQPDASGRDLRRALALRTKALGPDHPDVATTLIALSELQVDRGDLDEGRALLLRGLDIRQRTLGESHLETQRAEAQLRSLERCFTPVGGPHCRSKFQ